MTAPIPINRSGAEIGAVPATIHQKKIKVGMETNDLGTQPLDALMIKLKLSNHDLVAVSTEQLSHKVVQKGRKGRRLTAKAKNKILAALHAACPERQFAHRDLFNY